MSELLMHPMGGGTGSDDVTATAANVLSGKTAVTSDSDDEAIAGTMPNNGSMNVTLTPGGNGSTSQAVAEGYYSGGTITANGQAAYSAGHSQGVTDADNRVNTASASYSSGYANGHNQGVTDGINSVNIDFFCLWAFESNASNWQGHGYSLRNSLNKNGGNIVSVGDFGWYGYYNGEGGNTRHGSLTAKVNCTIVSNKGTWNLNAGQSVAVSICDGNNDSGQWEGYAYAR